VIALGVSLALFLVYLTLGLGVTALFPRSFPPGMRLRLAPGVGVGLYLIFAIALSRWGLPVKAFVYPLTLTLFVASVVAIIVRPPLPSGSEVTGFVAPLLVACVLVGSPLMTFGFHWLSYSNDDMANYSLGAQRFVDNGYFEPPTAATYLGNRTMNGFYWAWAAVDGERDGVEILLASAASVLHRNPFEVFMPLIFSAFLVIVVAAGAIGLRSSGSLVPALISCAVAASPLSGFGVFYQLLAQEFGLAGACSFAALLMGPLVSYRAPKDLVRSAVVSAVAGCGLLANYPEFLPFVVLGFILFLAARIGSLNILRVLAACSVTTIVVLVLLNAQALAMIVLIFRRLQLVHNANAAGATLFPYYLIPSGLANLWGLQPIASFFLDPVQSILIAVGGLLTAAVCVAAIFLTLRRDTPAAPMLCALILFGMFAVRTGEGFALYKLALFGQPFLVAVVVSTIAVAATGIRWVPPRARWVAIATPVLLLVVVGLPSLATYRDASIDHHLGSSAAFAEIPSGSRDALLVQVRDIARRTHNVVVVSDTPNVSLAKIQSGYFGDDSLLFSADDFFAGELAQPESPVPARDPTFSALSRNFSRERLREFARATFAFDPGARRHEAAFQIDRRIHQSETGGEPFLLSTTDRQTILNRDGFASTDDDVRIGPLAAASNHLAFVNSSLGGAPGPDTPRDRVSLFQLEQDYYFPGRTMASVGRYLLFSYYGRLGPLRLILDMTTTLNGDARNRLPPAAAIGRHRVSFHAIGRGSARLVSDPILPLEIDGESYVGIDMGTPGAQLPDHRTGLMRLYGGNVPIDSRNIVGFARDISAIPARSISRRDTPSAIGQFPQDLGNPALFYSGIYEDGWLAEDARIRLKDSRSGNHLRFQFMVPYIGNRGYSSSVTVTVDGKTRGTWPAPLGRTMIDFPAKLRIGQHDVQLHFAGSQRLPGLDTRLVSARIEHLGFE